MKEQKNLVMQLLQDESGATATEYIILLILIACFVIAVVRMFGDTLKHKWANANNVIDRELVF